MPLPSMNKALAVKPRGDVTRSPKQGYQWPHKRHMLIKNPKTKIKNLNILLIFRELRQSQRTDPQLRVSNR